VRSKWQSVADGPFNASAALGGRMAGDLAGLLAGGPAGPAGGVSLYATGTNGRQYGDQAATPGSFAGWVVI